MADPVALSEEVATALDESRPVVALETSVLAQGLPHPQNLDALDRMSKAVRERGAVPAWVSVGGGSVRVGTQDHELRAMAEQRTAAKVARRDLPMALAGGGAGATTVSATVWAAHRAGIQVAATGGIGGVHPGSGDVSPDLFELARTPITLVCSGPKSIVDPVATVERLEEMGIGVLGYRCDRLPFFLVREADIPIEHRAETPAEVAAAARARRALGIESTLVVCNPIPEGHALANDEVLEAVAECTKRAERRGIRGKGVTPFLLSCLSEVTAGRSLDANLVLLEENARLAGRVAAELAR